MRELLQLVAANFKTVLISIIQKNGTPSRGFRSSINMID